MRRAAARGPAVAVEVEVRLLREGHLKKQSPLSCTVLLLLLLLLPESASWRRGACRCVQRKQRQIDDGSNVAASNMTVHRAPRGAKRSGAQRA